jgi:hypothetical protein
MKMLIYSLIGFAFLSSCESTQKLANKAQKENEIRLHEGSWYFNFKNEVFVSCLKKLYPHSFSIMIDSVDASSTANIDQLDYNRKIIDIADSLATNFTKRQETLWTIEAKKVTLNVCMRYRNSIELDSAAVFFFKKFHEKK